MHIKSQRDFCSGLMFVAFGVVFAVGAAYYPMGASMNPGAGLFPLALGLLLAFLGAIVMFKSLTIETEGGDPIGAAAWRPLFSIVGAVVVFGLGIDRLGFVLTVPLVIIVASLGGRRLRWPATLLNAAALTLIAWLVFIVGLKLTLPLWPALGTG
jgi:Tripartite tricarboxylate transporter TctB family